MEIYVKNYFHFFLVFKHDFIRCVDFTHIAASSTASDDVTNKVTHIYVIQTYHIRAHFLVEIDVK